MENSLREWDLEKGVCERLIAVTETEDILSVDVLASVHYKTVIHVPLDERIRHGRRAVDQDYHTALESCIDYWITKDSNPSIEKLL